MGTKYPQLQSQHLDFIAKQHIFFSATATRNSKINLSPKDGRALTIINSKQLLWLNLTGSGNETQAHLQEDGRMTIMFCSFTKDPRILRLYGNASSTQPHHKNWQKTLANFTHLGEDYLIGVRQIIQLDIDLVVNSCGFGVPVYEFINYRDRLTDWSHHKGRAGIVQYQKEKNAISLDGKVIL